MTRTLGFGAQAAAAAAPALNSLQYLIPICAGGAGLIILFAARVAQRPSRAVALA